MAEYNIAAPQAGLVSPASWGSRSTIKKMLQGIITKYGAIITKVSKLTNVPKEVIAAFIAVESGGNPTAGPQGHITQGLMQWNRNYIDSTLNAEKRLGRLSKEEEDLLATYGIVFKDGKVRKITNADQLKPELNILIGSILLGQFIDSYYDGGKGGKKQKEWATDPDGTIRLDRIISVYNTGAYGEAGKKAISATYKTAAEQAKNVNSITSAYINKILGLNGAYDILTSDLANQI